MYKKIWVAAITLFVSPAIAAPPQYNINLGSLANGYYTNQNGYLFAPEMVQTPSGAFTFRQSDANGNATSAPVSTLSPSAADANATTIAAANTWQTLFNIGYGTHGTYIAMPSALVCVGVLGQSGACTCSATAGGQNIFPVAASAGLATYGVNNSYSMSICSPTVGATFYKGAY